MRIAFVITRPEPFGMQLAEAIKKIGHQVEYFYLPGGHQEQSYNSVAPELNTVRTRSHDFDVIQAFGDPQGITAFIGTTTPVIVTMQETPPDALLKNAGGNMYYITVHESSAAQPNSCLGCIPVCGSMDSIAQQYVHAYQRVVQNTTVLEEYRPWGYYVVLGEQAAFKVKKTVVYPGRRLSLQRHQRRREHWLIVQGRARVTLNEVERERVADQSIDIPRESLHRIENIGSDDVVFIEIQTGDYFGEDDIERLEDDFGRVS